MAMVTKDWSLIASLVEGSERDRGFILSILQAKQFRHHLTMNQSLRPSQRKNPPSILEALHIRDNQILGREERENDDGLEFLPEVPRGTATLLSLAEEKLKAKSFNSRVKARQEQRRSLYLSSTPKNVTDSTSISGQHNISSAHEIQTTEVRPSRSRSTNRTRRSSKPKSSTGAVKPLPTTNLDEYEEEPEHKLITVGGYIMNIERGVPSFIKASISPTISNRDDGLEVHVRITGVTPSSISVEKRYNSILVLGVQDPAITNNEFIEVINIFAPRHVFLARMMVSEPDDTGLLTIKAP